MAIWAISDFHLSFGVKDKPMNIFGENWNGYEEKLREKERLIRSLNLAKEAGYKKMIVMLHYNLSNNKDYLEIMKRYPVSHCVYGHLHGKAEPLVSENSGILFSCTSCDLIGFDPILIE